MVLIMLSLIFNGKKFKSKSYLFLHVD